MPEIKTESPLDLLKKAQREQNAKVAQQRIELLRSLSELEQIGAKDSYEQSLVAILNEYPDGIGLSQLRRVLPDNELLNSARRDLKKRITESKEGASLVLKLTTLPKSEAEEE